METQTPKDVRTPQTSNEADVANPTEFAAGSTVIYGLHGRCNVLAIEERQVGSDRLRFYKLEVQRSSLSRSTRPEPAIWLPVGSARARGLRSPLSREESERVFAIIGSREFFFPLNESWSSVHPKLEAAIRAEGAMGMAKVLSYLHVLKRRQIVPSPEVAKMHENVAKLLFRELAEATNESVRDIEHKVVKGMRQKLIPDT